MIVTLNRYDVEHRFLHVYRIVDADQYIVLEPFHDMIEHQINGSWYCNTDAITIYKSEYDYMEVINDKTL